MNEKKEKKRKKPEMQNLQKEPKNWRTSAGMKLLAMVLAVISGFFVAVTGVITVTLSMDSDLQGSQKDIEKSLDTELLRSYAYWMGNEVTGQDDAADALKKFDDGNIVYSLVKSKSEGEENELVCGNYTGTALNKENALAWLKFTDENECNTGDLSFWDMLFGRYRGLHMKKTRYYTEVDHFIYDDGVIYCYAGDTLFRINSFSFSMVPTESDLLPYMEYTYRESDDGGGYCDGNGELLKKSQLEPYLKSSELRFDFDGLEAGYLWSKTDGIYPIRKESIAETYPKAEVFQWEDFSFAYEENQGRIYYNPHQEKEVTEYTLYLTVADPLKGSKASVSSLFSDEFGGGTHIVIDSGKTQFFQKAHTLAGVVVQLRKTSGWWLLLSVLVWLVSLGILFVSAGWKKGFDTIQIRRIDRIPFGIYTGITGLVVIGCGLVCLYMGNDLFGHNTKIGYGAAYFTIAFALAELIGYEYVISIIVRIRAGEFWHYTVLHALLRPLRWCKKKLHAMGNAVSGNLSMIGKASGLFLAVFLLEFFLLLIGNDGVFLFFLWKVAEYGILLKLLTQFKKILDGGERIAKGDYSNPIPVQKMPFELQKHAKNLNNVQAGVAAAVEEKMKSERFRTELITNVSHDIKTPLTSIINYVDLIQKEPLESETLKEYVAVLERQSNRLKKLIEDLMEASKASTGNLPVNAQVCDATVMLTQIVGEFSERAQAQNLEMVVDCPKPPVNIYVDGRHLWRIIDNLMGNICKYAQPGTRVYISLEQYHGMVIMTFRNISRERLKMESEELFGRFVRGDSSRNTEGNGLGLSIAKSLTELMHGNLAVQIDGDLFKVILSFDEYRQGE